MFWIILMVLNIAGIAWYITGPDQSDMNGQFGFILNMLSFWLAIYALVAS